MNAATKPEGRPSAAALLRAGSIAMALYLAVLPYNHLAAAKNLSLTVALVCALLIWQRAEDKHIPLFPAFVVWLAAATASLLWSHDVQQSLEAIWRDVGKTWLVFFSFFALARNGAPLAPIMRIAVVGAAIFALLAIHDFATHGWWENYWTPARYDVGVDALNWMVFIGMLGAANLRWQSNRLLPWLGLLAVIALVVAGVMTQSRSFNLAVVLGTVLIVALNFRRISRHQAALAMVSAVAVVVAVVFFAVVLLDKPLGEYTDRWVLYSTVWKKIAANLWQGSGFGHETDQAWYHATFDHSPVPGVPSGLTHPHNIVLSYMDQMGIWGLLVLAILFWSIGKPLWSALRTGNRWQARLGQAGLLLLLVTLLSNSFNYYFARQHLWMFFAMLGLFFGWIRAAPGDGDAASEPATLPDAAIQPVPSSLPPED